MSVCSEQASKWCQHGLAKRVRLQSQRPHAAAHPDPEIRSALPRHFAHAAAPPNVFCTSPVPSAVPPRTGPVGRDYAAPPSIAPGVMDLPPLGVAPSMQAASSAPFASSPARMMVAIGTTYALAHAMGFQQAALPCWAGFGHLVADLHCITAGTWETPRSATPLEKVRKGTVKWLWLRAACFHPRPPPSQL